MLPGVVDLQLELDCLCDLRTSACSAVKLLTAEIAEISQRTQRTASWQRLAYAFRRLPQPYTNFRNLSPPLTPVR